MAWKDVGRNVKYGNRIGETISIVQNKIVVTFQSLPFAMFGGFFYLKYLQKGFRRSCEFFLHGNSAS